jgi:hypothetical protein
MAATEDGGLLDGHGGRRRFRLRGRAVLGLCRLSERGAVGGGSPRRPKGHGGEPAWRRGFGEGPSRATVTHGLPRSRTFHARPGARNGSVTLLAGGTQKAPLGFCPARRPAPPSPNPPGRRRPNRVGTVSESIIAGPSRHRDPPASAWGAVSRYVVRRCFPRFGNGEREEVAPAGFDVSRESLLRLVWWSSLHHSPGLGPRSGLLLG